MFYHILYPLSNYIPALNIFRYITFRAAYTIITALLICLIFGPIMIKKLKEFQIGQAIRQDGPQSHLPKSGTPTMGGLLIILAIIIPTLLWGKLTNIYLWLAIYTTIFFGLIGFLDDFKKIIKHESKGLSAKTKILLQIVLAGIFVFALWQTKQDQKVFEISLPFFKNFILNLNYWYFPLAVILLSGLSNAVNLTDGLDGLAIGCVVIAAAALSVLAYLSGNAVAADYLKIPNIKGSGELTIFCSAIIGAGLGFLWYNAHPAEVFMGDVGSLSLGAALAAVGIMVKQEIILLIISGVFIMEALSVTLQVGYFKLTNGKRIFRMAPLHHHFELKGWPESKVIVRFWIMAILIALIGLSFLKIR